MASVSVILLLVFCETHAREESPAADFVVHEWGTFTSIAGEDGRPVAWSPLETATDLPGFVEHLETRNFKLGLTGTVRMETPIIYFYSAQARRVSVHVSFSKGLITEWYPRVSSAVPDQTVSGTRLSNNAAPDGSVTWDSLQIEPGARRDFPMEEGFNHYYAARQTGAAPLRVSSWRTSQREGFLFYRGVSNVVLPLRARVASNNSVELENRGESEIPTVVLFERRGSKVGYRVLGQLREHGQFHMPELKNSLESLRTDLTRVLISQGLYADEASAMVQTWKHSWFEEGSRLFYIVPRKTVDTILPLSIEPAPAATVRVFVGRLELVTPATQDAVGHAFETRDRTTLKKYGRFLEPILQTMLQSASDSSKKERLERDLHFLYGDRTLQARAAREPR